jgi:hypothetical protein
LSLVNVNDKTPSIGEELQSSRRNSSIGARVLRLGYVSMYYRRTEKEMPMSPHDPLGASGSS